MLSYVYNWIYIVAGAVVGVLFLVLAVVDFSQGYSSDGGQDLLYALLSFGAGTLLYFLNRKQHARKTAEARNAGQGRW